MVQRWGYNIWDVELCIYISYIASKGVGFIRPCAFKLHYRASCSASRTVTWVIVTQEHPSDLTSTCM